ncbi:MAG: TonB family protein [Candidatus Cloacimonadota bacterium]|nr:MAG: TonB family protein [Candidatus Cloacimonadota bacterium]
MKKLKLTLFIILLFLISCQKGDKEVFTGERGGGIIIGTINEPTTLNPIYPPFGKSIGVENLLFLSLHGRNAEGKVVPQLATSWEYSEDFKSITYYLRRGVKWSDGKPVTAEDVKFTFDLIKSPDVGSPLAASVRFIDSVKVINSYRICFYFKRAYADELLDSGITPLPMHILKDVKDVRNASFNTSPVGNGPYKLKKWESRKSMELVANDRYYKGKPPLDKLVFWFAPGEEELAMELLEGNVDIVTDVTPSLYERIKDKKDINLIIKPGHTYTYIGWNLEKSLFAEKKMRLALTYAVSRENLVKDVLLNLADVARGPIPPTSWAYDEGLTTFSYNPEEAAKLFDEMGWKLQEKAKIRRKGNSPLSFTLITNKENPIRVQIAKFVEAELGKVGVLVRTEFLDTPTFISRLVSGDFDAFILGWSIKERIDPTMVWNSDPDKGKFNLVSYKNPKIDTMIDRGLLTLDRRETKKIWAAFQKIIAEDIPNTFLFYPQEISAASRRVNGIEENDTRFILANLEHYWIPSSLRKTIDVTSLGAKEEEEEIIEEKPEPEKPIVNPEDLLEKKAKEAAAKEAIPEPEKKVVEEKKEPILEPKPEKKETTEVVKEPEPEILPTLPKIKRLVIPEYPEAAKKVGAEGNVFVQVLIGVDGKVKKAKIVKTFGNPVCDAAALGAARATLWIPGTKNGKPVEMKQTYPVRFPP